jgi:asparagine synthase (glutamine-hydrolysing)
MALRNGGRPSEAERHLNHWAERVADRGLLERLAYMDIEAHLEPRLLRDLDAMSMAHSIEVRPVFLDHRLIEFLMHVPAPVRLQHKRLLFEASRRFLSCELLTDLEKRGKRTFTFPLAHWMSRELKPLVEETFSRAHLEASGILDADAVAKVWQRYIKLPAQVGWSRIWNLVVLVRWCEMMDVRP